MVVFLDETVSKKEAVSAMEIGMERLKSATKDEFNDIAVIIFDVLVNVRVNALVVFGTGSSRPNVSLYPVSTFSAVHIMMIFLLTV